MSSTRTGFTLLEMLLVLALIGVLLLIAYPSMEAMYGDLRVKAAADGVRAAWAEARARAVDEGRPYRFSFVPDQGNYRVAPDSPEFWGGGEGSPDAGTLPPLILDETLPKGVRFRNPEALRQGALENGTESSLPKGSVEPNLWSLPISFLPTGSVTAPQENVEIGLEAPGTRPLVVRLRTLTGVVTVRPFGERP